MGDIGMINMQLMRATRAIINLDNLSNNLREIRKTIPQNTKIAAVIKANAYGHGSVKIAEVLINEGIDYLGVAALSEALELRRYFDDIPILVMGYIPDEQLQIAVEKDISCTIFSFNQAQILSAEGKRHSKKANVHIKIDTGFHRLGLWPSNETTEVIKNIASLDNIYIEGIFTHLALVDADEDRKQFNIFVELNEKLEKEKIYIPIKHICDSISAAVYKDFCLDMIRPGATLYGYISRKTSMNLKPVMTLETRIASIMEIEKGEGVSYDYTFISQRKTKVATLPIGYGDGLPRALSNKGFFFLRGQKAVIIGKICMDQCMVDVTDIEDIKVGDIATLYGYHHEQTVSLSDVANLAGTNRNEILSLVSRRVPRVYMRDNRIESIIDYLVD